MPSSPFLARLTASLATLAVSALSAAALAQAPPPAEVRDTAEPERADPWAGVRRPWLYAADPTAPPPGHVLASMGIGYAQVNRGAARPFAADLAHAGAVFSAAAEVGIFRFASIQAEGLLAGQGSSVNAGAMIGATVYPLRAGGPIGLSFSGGYLRELGSDNGVWGRAAFAANLGPARLVVTALGEHVFAASAAEKRDGVDLLLTAGATYALTETVHLGAEYVVQDLESAWDPEELDGGIRHFLGPMASIELARRVQLTAGPSFGLSKGSPTVLGRLAANYAF